MNFLLCNRRKIILYDWFSHVDVPIAIGRRHRTYMVLQDFNDEISLSVQNDLLVPFKVFGRFNTLSTISFSRASKKDAVAIVNAVLSEILKQVFF